MPFDLRALGLGAALSLTLIAPARAQTAEVEALMDALRFGEVVEIMRVEGLDYAEELARDMLPGGETDAWQEAVATIYDPARMEATVRASFVESFGDTDAAPLVEFFTEGPGADFVRLENSARAAMSDDSVEESAREMARAAVEDPDDRFALLERFVAANDLVESNVEGAMNASYQFYRGLSDGGGIELGEEDILRDVWAQETEMRADTGEWVYAFLLMAYRPMEDAAIERYIDLSETEAGEALNVALFSAFDRMYADISYALGLALARNMGTQEL